MDEMSSDPESVLSVDSLEACEGKHSSQINSSSVNTSLSNSGEVTVPFYVGDVLIQHIPKVNSKGVRMSNSVPNNLSGDKKCHSARNGNRPRLSRKNILKVEENSNLVRSRYRSVSYLERFRGKLYGASQTTSSIISTGGSYLREQSSCMSTKSFVSEDTSEYEYYLDLTKEMENTQLTVNNKVVQLPDPTYGSKEKKNVRLNKGISTMILSKIKDTKPKNESKEPDKKNAMAKQEAYANEVRLQNRIKINRQRQKEKVAKMMIKEECHYHNNKNITETSKSSLMDLPPFLVNEMPAKESQTKIKLIPRKKIPKTKKSEKINKKPDEISNLTILQLRHENEKNLVDSMRRLVLKI